MRSTTILKAHQKLYKLTNFQPSLLIVVDLILIVSAINRGVDYYIKLFLVEISIFRLPVITTQLLVPFFKINLSFLDIAEFFLCVETNELTWSVS
ncbi:hypothetical protein BpHYR1_041923 [Brachionus plicatilis]|uniref:Uncharacterized protein n=1 Tax=Brachionus plicatilis TaxID=10195 RepID=A0A3M7SJ01_BRAPC|nr:hypothetical protein BpHYR1_041923 [Brachionus plicatilis]